MYVLRFPLGQMQANCYFLIVGTDCVILDPGDSADFILEELLRRNLNLKAILATHGHIDHIMAVGEIQSNFAVPFYVHKDDIFLVDRVAESAEHFLDYKPVIIRPQNITHISGDSISVRDFSLQVIYTPGHTPGSVCFFAEQYKILFTGDTLFKDGIGRYDFRYSNKMKLKYSLEKLFAIDDIIKVYPGHGEDTLLHIEKEAALSLFS